MKDMLSKAFEIISEAHKGQKDKVGDPYFLHLIRVMQRGKNDTEKICGLLHDLVEDTDWTFERLESEGFSNKIIDVLRCVTKFPEDEDYEHFINRIKKNKTAVNVKLNDLQDNMDITRLNTITKIDVARLRKYLKAYRELIEFREKYQ